MEKNGSADDGRKKRGENVDDYELGYRGSGHEGLSIYSGMENHVMVAEQKRTGHEKRSSERDKMEAQIRIPQQRSAVGYSDVEMGGRRGGLDTASDTKPAPQGGRDDQPPENDEAADGEEA